MRDDNQGSPTRILLIRHGRTSYNAENRFMGQTDVPLDDTGIRQAHALSAVLCQWNPVCIYCSPLSRARETARRAARELDVPLIQDERWQEVDLGRLAGLTWKEAAEHLPDYHQKRTAGAASAPPGGESTTSVQRRAVEGFTQIAGDHPNQTAAVVSHGGTIKSLLSWVLSAPLQEKWRIAIANASLTVVRLTPRGWQVCLLNYTGHLPGD